MREKPLILIVDDCEDGRELYVDFLESVGYRVTQAADGRDALRIAFERLPSLVVMDLGLPVVDGWEATRALRANRRTSSVPVLALSGHTESLRPSILFEAGFDDYLVKPCLPEDLLRKVRRLLTFTSGVVAAAVHPLSECTRTDRTA